MALDITAFSKTRFIHNKKECSNGEHHRIWSLPNFIDRLDGKQVGCYVARGKEMYFPLHYSGYNKWRELLANAALGKMPEVIWERYNDFKGKPFAELIYMADNAGAFGPLTSAKLAKDFKNFEQSAKPKLLAVIKKRGLKRWFQDLGVDWWLETYNQFHAAFQLASDKGFVSFS